MDELLFLQSLDALADFRAKRLPIGDLKRAAVLLPLVADGSHRHLLFTKRTNALKHHPGQISFPGGRLEPGEAAWDAALRESWEEIGLPASKTRLLRQIGDAYSPRGYHISCFVALVSPFEPQINHREVAHLVSVEWQELFEDERHQMEPWQKNPEHMVHYFSFEEGLVWGVTGQITFNFREALRQLTHNGSFRN